MAKGGENVKYSYILMVDVDCKESVRCVKDAICSFSGIYHINIDMKEKKVHLKGNVDINEVVEAIRKKSKRETKIIHCSPDKPNVDKVINEAAPNEKPNVHICVINNFYNLGSTYK